MKIRKTILLASLAILSNTLFAVTGKKISETKEAVVLISVTENPSVEIDGKDTELEISTWTLNKVEIKARIEFKGEETDEMREFLDDFQKIVEQGISKSGNNIEINTILDAPNKFDLGTKLFNFITVSYSEKELSISYKVKLPSASNIETKNSYQDIMMLGMYSGVVSVDHYSGDFTGGIFTDLNLKMKYGEAVIKKVAQGDFDFYEQELEIEEFTNGSITSKYSDIQIKNGGNIKFDDYESNYEIVTIDNFSGNLKYGSINIMQRANELSFGKLYEVDLEGTQINNLIIDESKYSRYDYRKGNKLSIQSSYEDDIEIESLADGKLSGKYAKIEIGSIEGDFTINDGYEIDIKFKEILTNTGVIKIDGKYITVSATDVKNSLWFVMRADYGNLEYDKNNYVRNLYIKENSKLTVDLEKGEKPRKKLTVSGYEVKVYL